MNWTNRVPLVGTVDGENVTFTLPITPAAGASIDLVAFAPQVGLVLAGTPVESYQYSRNNLTIVLALAPQTEDERPRATYAIAEAVAGATPVTGGTGATAFYQRMRSLAARQIATYGKSLTLTRRTAEPSYSTSTGHVTLTTESVAFKGAVFNIDARNADGTTVLQSDKRVLAVLNNEPQVGNAIEGITDIDHTVMAVRPLCPGDVTVFYEMQVRA